LVYALNHSRELIIVDNNGCDLLRALGRARTKVF
jgi:hypothetical protein